MNNYSNINYYRYYYKKMNALLFPGQGSQMLVWDLNFYNNFDRVKNYLNK